MYTAAVSLQQCITSLAPFQRDGSIAQEHRFLQLWGLLAVCRKGSGRVSLRVLYIVRLVLCLSWWQASAKGVPAALAELRQTVGAQLQPPAGFQEELAAQAEQGGLINPGDWSQGSDKWAEAWLAICQVCVCLSVILS